MQIASAWVLLINFSTNLLQKLDSNKFVFFLYFWQKEINTSNFLHSAFLFSISQFYISLYYLVSMIFKHFINVGSYVRDKLSRWRSSRNSLCVHEKKNNNFFFKSKVESERTQLSSRILSCFLFKSLTHLLLLCLMCWWSAIKFDRWNVFKFGMKLEIYFEDKWQLSDYLRLWLMIIMVDIW